MKLLIRNRSRTFAILLVLLLMAACKDEDLKTASNALNDAAHGVGVLQNTAIEANKQGLLSEASTRRILEAALKVNTAGKEAVSITRGINELAPQDRTNILAILRPVIDSLNQIDLGGLGINDAKTQQNIRAAFAVISTALNTAQLALASR